MFSSILSFYQPHSCSVFLVDKVLTSYRCFVLSLSPPLRLNKMFRTPTENISSSLVCKKFVLLSISEHQGCLQCFSSDFLLQASLLRFLSLWSPEDVCDQSTDHTSQPLLRKVRLFFTALIASLIETPDSR